MKLLKNKIFAAKIFNETSCILNYNRFHVEGKKELRGHFTCKFPTVMHFLLIIHSRYGLKNNFNVLITTKLV